MSGTTAPAPFTPARLQRNELLHLLDRSGEFALTFLLAPAGFGKSTLLQQWQQHRPDLRTVLLPLDAGDADPVRFFRRLSNVLRQAVPDFDTLYYNPLSAEIALPPAAVAEALEQALAAVPGPLWLLFDDFQHAHTPFIQQVMALALQRLPSHIHVVMTSRRHPGFSLSRLKLDDRLLMIDEHDLRLDARQLGHLAGQLGLELTPPQVERLLTLTEGWVAGVRMALLAQARTGPGAVECFNGRQPEIMDYFAHVVLRDLTPDQHDFALCTAVLEEFDAAFCDAVLGRRDSARLLNHIATQALFLQECADRPGWFRYHTLLQDFLESRLGVEMPERVEQLHSDAASYLLQQGETERALAHSQRGPAGCFAATLSRSCAIWLSKGNYPAILRWIGALTDEELAVAGDLALPFISALIFSRRFNQARYYLDILQAEATPAAGRFAGDSAVIFLEMMLQLFQNDTDFRLHADQAVLLESCRHHDIRAFSLAMLAYHQLQHANFVAARQYALQAKTVLGQLGYIYLESYADLILILCDNNSGDSVAATRRSEDFYARTQDDRHSPSWVNATTAIAVVRYEQNCLDEAQRLCEEVLPQVNTCCATELLVAVYLTLSRLLSLKGDRRRAQRLTAQLHRILRLGNYDRFVAQLACEEMLQAMALGTREDVGIVARLHELEERMARQTWQAVRPYEESWERYGLATALYLRNRDRLPEALHVLEVLSVSSRQAGVLLRAVVIDANRAVILHQRGDTAAAMELVRQLIREHGLQSINRLVLDEAPGMASLMRQAHQHYQVTLPEIYLAIFQEVLAPPADGAQPEPMVPAESTALTDKETEIFELLQQGLSNNAISSAIGIALSTTKWHLKNIFAKLGVANRTAAILRAAQIGQRKVQPLP
ncbi:MAG: LuxR family transcriptional regulator [Moraxellaceae bacterium]|jgi:LuxR family maltose regulon positive regulatory protein|nr:LuxR family transcriptional regulator [Moraxellaceae bacterium]